MGRITWESIPERYRPLNKRYNIVISRNPKYRADGAEVVTSLDDALELACSKNDIHNTYVIGGASIYKEALSSHNLRSVFVTEILQEFDCDVSVPNYKKIKGSKRVWSSSEIDENGIKYRFSRYNYNNQLSLEEILHMEQRVALEIYEHEDFGTSLGNTYAKKKSERRYDPCSQYLRDLYKALEVSRHLYAKNKEFIKTTKLELEPLPKRSIPRGAPDEEKFRYTFTVELEDGTVHSNTHTHACFAICSLCLKMNTLFRRKNEG